MTVQLALTPDGRWDYATADLVSAASAAGFTAAGINADRVDAAAVEAYCAAGARCHELLALIVSDDEPATLTSAGQLELKGGPHTRVSVCTGITGVSCTDAVARGERWRCQVPPLTSASFAGSEVISSMMLWMNRILSSTAGGSTNG
jgi:hypothetical protein